MDVQIDVYSGRPNPRFRLDPLTGAAFVRQVAGLRPSAGGARPRDGLGYRGLYVRPDPGSPVAEFFVSDGVVLVRNHDGREQVLDDPGRDLERGLVDAMESAMDPGMLALLRDELS